MAQIARVTERLAPLDYRSEVVVIDVNVQRAAAYLDYFHPGWFYQVDLNTLDMFSCTKCVLGQIMGWAEGASQWGETVGVMFGGRLFADVKDYDPATSEMGFSRGVFHSNTFVPDWTVAIQQRLSVNQAAVSHEAVCHE